MNRLAASFAGTAMLLGIVSPAGAADDWIERLDDYLALSAFHGTVRARLSGLIDLEAYSVDQPSPGLIFSEENQFVNPRLSVFLDVQVGPYVYAFAQARVDRGFDPSDHDVDVRLDEYAIRISPWEDGRLSIQAGRFSTVVGNWVPRHLSWDNPFITAPIPYENLTGIWDIAAPDSPETLLDWSHVRHPPSPGFDSEAYEDKVLRLPIVWEPSYATGLAISGKLGQFEYAVEMKNAGLASRPESWDLNEVDFDHPSFNGRLGWRPNPTWNFGFSLGSETYLVREAEPSLPPGRDVGDYRELLLAQDISFEWHHLQIWTEFYEVRFEVPGVGNVDTLAYYVEGKYKFTPQLYGALRWNHQVYDSIPLTDGSHATWGDNLWRIDAALGYRFTAFTQLKLQYSLGHHDDALHDFETTLAAQFTVKF